MQCAFGIPNGLGELRGEIEGGLMRGCGDIKVRVVDRIRYGMMGYNRIGL